MIPRCIPQASIVGDIVLHQEREERNRKHRLQGRYCDQGCSRKKDQVSANLILMIMLLKSEVPMAFAGNLILAFITCTSTNPISSMTQSTFQIKFCLHCDVRRNFPQRNGKVHIIWFLLLNPCSSRKNKNSNTHI